MGIAFGLEWVVEKGWKRAHDENSPRKEENHISALGIGAPHIWGCAYSINFEQLSKFSTVDWGYPQFFASYPQFWGLVDPAAIPIYGIQSTGGCQGVQGFIHIIHEGVQRFQARLQAIIQQPEEL